MEFRLTGVYILSSISKTLHNFSTGFFPMYRGILELKNHTSILCKNGSLLNKTCCRLGWTVSKNIFFFAYLFHVLFSLSLTPIISLFYCLNYTLLLLHLITTHLVSHLSLSSIVFIISKLIICIIYCLNYTSLLLHLFRTHLVIDFITV